MSTKRKLKVGGIYSVDWIAGDGLGSALWNATLRWDGKRWVNEHGRARNIVPKAARLVPLRMLHDAWKVKLAEEAVRELAYPARLVPPPAALHRIRELFKTKRRGR